jgi:hypothetical protein
MSRAASLFTPSVSATYTIYLCLDNCNHRRHTVMAIPSSQERAESTETATTWERRRDDACAAAVSNQNQLNAATAYS